MMTLRRNVTQIRGIAETLQDGAVAMVIKEQDGELPDNLCACCRMRIELQRNRPADTERISFSEHTVGGVRLTASHWTIFEALYAARGKVVGFPTLIVAVWGDWDRLDRSSQPENTLKVHICKMRDALIGTGFGIESIWGRGYRLVEEADAPVRRKFKPPVEALAS